MNRDDESLVPGTDRKRSTQGRRVNICIRIGKKFQADVTNKMDDAEGISHHHCTQRGSSG